MNKRDLKRIVQAKAKFLGNYGDAISYAGHLKSIRRQKKEIDQMPRRGFKQRCDLNRALEELSAQINRFHALLGSFAMNTYHFVEEHKALLTKKQRSKMGLD